MPQQYVGELVRILDRTPADVVQWHRHVFYLTEPHLQQVLERGALQAWRAPERVRQNIQGMSIAVRRDAYFRLGGHDESFVGWGGEDNEFHDRCEACPHWFWGHVPLYHLWHPWQPGKGGGNTEASERLDRLLQVPAAIRAEHLRNLDWGRSHTQKGDES